MGRCKNSQTGRGRLDGYGCLSSSCRKTALREFPLVLDRSARLSIYYRQRFRVKLLFFYSGTVLITCYGTALGSPSVITGHTCAYVWSDQAISLTTLIAPARYQRCPFFPTYHKSLLYPLDRQSFLLGSALASHLSETQGYGRSGLSTCRSNSPPAPQSIAFAMRSLQYPAEILLNCSWGPLYLREMPMLRS